MSLLAVQGGATGTGTVTLLAPVTNTNRTLTLPDVTGTVAVQGGAGVGKVLQMVNATYATSVSNSTSTYADTGLTATITPTSASSKIIVMINHPENNKSSANANNDIAFNIARNGSQIAVLTVNNMFTGTTVGQTTAFSYNYVDSPASTSALTYKTQFKNNDNNGAAVTVQVNGANSPASLILLEIGA
jgi:hypothetical protein